MILRFFGRINTDGDTSLCSRELVNVLHHENNPTMVPDGGEARDALAERD